MRMASQHAGRISSSPTVYTTGNQNIPLGIRLQFSDPTSVLFFKHSAINKHAHIGYAIFNIGEP